MEKEGKEKTDPDSNPRETECFLTGQYWTTQTPLYDFKIFPSIITAKTMMNFQR